MYIVDFVFVGQYIAVIRYVRHQITRRRGDAGASARDLPVHLQSPGMEPTNMHIHLLERKKHDIHVPTHFNLFYLLNYLLL